MRHDRIAARERLRVGRRADFEVDLIAFEEVLIGGHAQQQIGLLEVLGLIDIVREIGEFLSISGGLTIGFESEAGIGGVDVRCTALE